MVQDGTPVAFPAARPMHRPMGLSTGDLPESSLRTKGTRSSSTEAAAPPHEGGRDAARTGGSPSKSLEATDSQGQPEEDTSVEGEASSVPHRPMAATLCAPLLDLLEERLGPAEVQELLKRAGFSQQRLRDPDGWLTVEEARRLNRYARETTGDPDIVREAGRNLFRDDRYLGLTWHLARRLGVTGFLRSLQFLSRMETYDRLSLWTVNEVGRNHAVVTYEQPPGFRDHESFCQNRIGACEAIPRLTGARRGRVEHPTCIHQGGDRCVYYVTWQGGARRWVRLGATVAVVGLVAAAAVWAGLPFGYVACVALGMVGMAVGTHSWRSLSARLDEQRNPGYFESLVRDKETSERRAMGLMVLRDLDHRLRRIDDEGEMLQATVCCLRDQLGYDRVAVFLAQWGSLTLRNRAGFPTDSRAEVAALRALVTGNEPSSQHLRVRLRGEETVLLEPGRAPLSTASDRFRQVFSLTGGYRCILTPVADGREFLGVLAVMVGEDGRLAEVDRMFAQRAAHSLALEMSNRRLIRGMQRREHELQQALAVSRKFSHYLPRPVVEKIARDPDARLQLGGDERQAAVLFTDIVGFTSLSENMEPGDVVDFLNRYFEEMDVLVEQHGGIVDKRLGDGLMVVFLEDAFGRHPVARAVRCVEEMHRAAAAIRVGSPGTRGAGKGAGIGLHAGLNYGSVVMGNIGSQGRMEYTIIGDVVNTAARLQAMATWGETLLTSSAARVLEPGEVLGLGARKLRNRRASVEVYRLLVPDGGPGRVRASEPSSEAFAPASAKRDPGERVGVRETAAKSPPPEPVSGK